MIFWLICVPFLFLGLCAIAAVIIGGRAESFMEMQQKNKIQSPQSSMDTAVFFSSAALPPAQKHRFRASG